MDDGGGIQAVVAVARGKLVVRRGEYMITIIITIILTIFYY